MNYPKELIKGTTKNLILAVLFKGEMYGYQIVKEIDRQSRGRLEFGEGSMYPALHALEQDGLLKSRWAAQEGRPDRKYYQLTDSGVRELQANVKVWKDFTEAVGEVLISAAPASI